MVAAPSSPPPPSPDDDEDDDGSSDFFLPRVRRRRRSSSPPPSSSSPPPPTTPAPPPTTTTMATMPLGRLRTRVSLVRVGPAGRLAWRVSDDGGGGGGGGRRTRRTEALARSWLRAEEEARITDPTATTTTTDAAGDPGGTSERGGARHHDDESSSAGGTTTWDGCGELATMMSSLDLSEIAVESADRNRPPTGVGESSSGGMETTRKGMTAAATTTSANPTGIVESPDEDLRPASTTSDAFGEGGGIANSSRGAAAGIEGSFSEGTKTTRNGRAAAMVSLDLSEIVESANDDRPTSDVSEGGAKSRPMAGVGEFAERTTSWKERAAMVSLSLSEIGSADENDDDSATRAEDEFGTSGHFPQRGDSCIDATAHGANEIVGGSSIFVCITEMPNRSDASPAPAPQCNGCANERQVNEMDGCERKDGFADMSQSPKIPFYATKGRNGYGHVANPFAEKLWRESEENDEFLMEETNARFTVTKEKRINEVEDRLDSGDTAADHVVRDIEVDFIMNMEGLTHDDETNYSGIFIDERPTDGPDSPSFGSMSSNASIDGSQSAHSDMEEILAVRNESLSSNKPANRPHRATTLSECLEAVRDCLLDSPDRKLDVAEVPSLNDPFAILFAHDRKSDVVEDPSPRDQLVFKYPCRSGVEDEVRYYVRHMFSILFGFSILLSS